MLVHRVHFHVIHGVKRRDILSIAPPYTVAVYNLLVVAQSKIGILTRRKLIEGDMITTSLSKLGSI